MISNCENGMDFLLVSFGISRSVSDSHGTTREPLASSICDALLASQPGKITFEINQSTLKKGLDVSDQEVRKTIKILAETLKLMVEPGGAVAAAALLSKKIEVKNKNIVVMLSGGNIDRELFSQIVTKDYE